MSDSTKITVNGVAYESVDAMPDDVRQVYERMLAGFPDLVAGPAEAGPKVLEGRFGPVQYRTVVRRSLVVNGKSSEDEASMPADARQAIELARHMADANDPNVKKKIVLTLRTSTPGLSIPGKAGRAPRSTQNPLTVLPSLPSPPAPIEPSATGVRIVPALAVAAALMTLAAWWLTRHH